MLSLPSPPRRLAYAQFLASRDGRVVRCATGATLALSGLMFAGIIRWPLLLGGAALIGMALLNYCPLGSWLRASEGAATTSPVLRVIAETGESHAPPTRRSA